MKLKITNRTHQPNNFSMIPFHTLKILTERIPIQWSEIASKFLEKKNQFRYFPTVAPFVVSESYGDTKVHRLDGPNISTGPAVVHTVTRRKYDLTGNEPN